MGIFDGSVSAGGSQNSSTNSAHSESSGYSRTYGTEASIRSAMEADRANAVQKNWFEQEMAYNAEQAQLQRDFNELMGNTIYTRSVKNMMEAGINPVLAANFGLSAANVNSGSTASASAPSAFMGQTFADQVSAWSSSSDSYGEGSGSSWNNSESGLATALSNMGEFIGSGLEALSSAKLFDIKIGNEGGNSVASKIASSIKDKVKDYFKTNGNWDSINHRQLSDKEMKEEGFWQGLNRSISNYANAKMGIMH